MNLFLCLMNIIEVLLHHIILKILIEKMSVLPLPMQLGFFVFPLYRHYYMGFISCFTFSAVAHSVWSQNKKHTQVFSFVLGKVYNCYFLSISIFIGT